MSHLCQCLADHKFLCPPVLRESSLLSIKGYHSFPLAVARKSMELADYGLLSRRSVFLGGMSPRFFKAS